MLGMISGGNAHFLPGPDDKFVSPGRETAAGCVQPIDFQCLARTVYSRETNRLHSVPLPDTAKVGIDGFENQVLRDDRRIQGIQYSLRNEDSPPFLRLC